MPAEFQHSAVLAGTIAVLQPLGLEYREGLLAAASDGALWNLAVTVVPGPSTIDAYIERALSGRNEGTVLPFAIVERKSSRVVGSTRFWRIDPANRKLEIGHTWLAHSAQRTGINTEVKYLMLRHAFETLDCVRVHSPPMNSVVHRTAPERRGGVICMSGYMPDGRKRNSVRFSIIDTEWPSVKSRLEALLG